MENQEKINPEENDFEKGLDTGHLRYDRLENFLSGVANGLIERSEADETKKMPDLAELEREAAEEIDEAVKKVAKMLKTYESHMKEKDKL